MSKFIIILVTVFIGFLFYYTYVVSRLFDWDFEIVEITPRNINETLSGGASVDVALKLILHNPSFVGVSIRDINLSVFYKGIKVVYTKVPIPLMRITANGTSSNNLSLNLPVNKAILEMATDYAMKKDLIFDYTISYSILFLNLTNSNNYIHKTSENG